MLSERQRAELRDLVRALRYYDGFSSGDLWWEYFASPLIDDDRSLIGLVMTVRASPGGRRRTYWWGRC